MDELGRVTNEEERENPKMKQTNFNKDDRGNPEQE